MAGLFQGLEIGRRALLTHQLNLQTIGHNIANVNTPGYSRQRVNITSTMPDHLTTGIVGTGVKAVDIRNIKDLFLGEQYRQENKSLGEWTYKEKVLSQIENLFNEPNDDTLSQLMTDFWSSWSDLATGVEGARENIVSQANKLTNGFHEIANQLNNLRDSIDRDLSNYTNQINNLTGEIARLNHLIKSQEVGNEHANDLRDQREILLDDLSALVDVNNRENADGTMTVYIGAMTIVSDTKSLDIESVVKNEDGKVTHNLVWEGSNVVLKSAKGQLKGLLDTRDKMIPKYIGELDRLAGTIVSEVNALHSTGYGANDSTDVNFFDPDKVRAIDIQLDSEIVFDSAKIAGSMELGKRDDNRIALEIANLQNKTMLNNGTATMDYYYNSMVSSLGIEVSESKSFKSNYELLVEQINYSKESIQGVSLDEEMTNMVKFQQAYDAAARVITTMDQALDTVISGMGVVGRY